MEKKEVKEEVIGKYGKVECSIKLSKNGGKGYLIKNEIGMNKIVV